MLNSEAFITCTVCFVLEQFVSRITFAFHPLCTKGIDATAKETFPKNAVLRMLNTLLYTSTIIDAAQFLFLCYKRKEDKNIKGSLPFSYIGRRALGTFNKFKFRYIRCTYHLHRITGIFCWEIIFGKLLKIWAVVCDDAIPSSPPPPSRVYNILRNPGYLPFTQTTLAQILCIKLTI